MAKWGAGWAKYDDNLNRKIVAHIGVGHARVAFKKQGSPGEFVIDFATMTETNSVTKGRVPVMFEAVVMHVGRGTPPL